MNRKALLHAAALLTLLGSACPLCETSCVSSEEAPMLDGDRALSDLFARSEQAAPTPAMQREWLALRARYAEALRVHGASPLLAQARLAGSATVAVCPDAADRFRQGIARVDGLARLGRSPNAVDMAALQRLIVSDAGSTRLRVAGERAAPGAGGDRAYLSGAFVAQEVERVFAALTGELSAHDDAFTPAIAARLDQKLVSIHPYVDGNGRIARLIADWVLVKDGFPPVVPTMSAALHATHGASENVAAAAHLERITDGMRNAVLLAELGTAIA